MPELTQEQQAKLKYRQRLRTDKFELSAALGYDFQPDVHTELFDTYIKFDPKKPYFEQDSQKHRLVLWSRAFYKTTSTIVEMVQTILNFPDVSIMIMQSTVPKSKELLALVKGHFDGTNHNSKLDAYFPEFCKDKLGTANSFVVPTRTRIRRDPTVFVASPRSSKAGLHPDVGFFDDLVTEQNYSNPEQLKKTIEQFSHYTPLVNNGGYFYVTGTRYAFGDLYEHITRSNTDEKWKVTVKGCWPEDKDGLRVGDSNFPKRKLTKGPRTGETIGISLEELLSIQRENPETFAAQYLNRPIAAGNHLFPEALLLSRVVSQESLPALSAPIVVVDLAGSTSETADHSVIMTGKSSHLGSVYVTDIRGGAWTPHQTAQQLLDVAVKYRPTRILVEHTQSATFFIEYVKVLARDKKLNLPLDFIKVTNVRGAKYMRIAALQGRFTARSLWFLVNLPQWELLLEQFAQFPKGRHDDYPDTVGLLCQHFGIAVPQIPPRARSMFDVIMAAPTLDIVKAVETPAPTMTLGSDFA